MTGRHTVDTLGLKAAVVNRRFNAIFAQALIGQLGPPLTPMLGGIWNLVAATMDRVQLGCFLAVAGLCNRASGQQDMRVIVALVAVLARLVDANVRSYAVVVRHFPRKVHCQPTPFFWRQFIRQGYFKLTSNQRIASLMMLFDAVPQVTSRQFGTAIWQNDISRIDAGLASIVVNFSCAFIGDFTPSAVSGSGSRTSTSRPTQRFHAEMINRHAVAFVSVFDSAPQGSHVIP
jgi:hypothetical protein